MPCHATWATDLQRSEPAKGHCAQPANAMQNSLDGLNVTNPLQIMPLTPVALGPYSRLSQELATAR